MIAVIVAIAEKHTSAIVAICGFHMIAAIAEKVNEVRGDLCHIVRAICQIQHGGCESSIPA